MKHIFKIFILENLIDNILNLIIILEFIKIHNNYYRKHYIYKYKYNIIIIAE